MTPDLHMHVKAARKMFSENFHKFEHDILIKIKENQEKYVTKDDLVTFLNRIHEYKHELEKLIAGLEREVAKPRQPVFTDLNFLNLRKKYHDFVLNKRSEEVDSFGYDPIFDEYISPFFDFLYTKYWRVEAFGMENIPASGPSLLVANHSGTLPYDATMLKMAMEKEHSAPRKLRFMVEDFLFHFPFLGSLMNRFGGVRASQENAEELLKRGEPVVVFPEGVKGLGKLYRDKYQLARFGRGGFIRLCLKTQTPLVPVAVIGAEEIHPMLFKDTVFSKYIGVPYIPITYTFPLLGPLGFLPLPSKWSIHALPEISFQGYEKSAKDDRALVHSLALDVKERIQKKIDVEVAKRKSIWN